MTMRYAHLAPDHLETALRFNPLATLPSGDKVAAAVGITVITTTDHQPNLLFYSNLLFSLTRLHKWVFCCLKFIYYPAILSTILKISSRDSGLRSVTKCSVIPQ